MNPHDIAVFAGYVQNPHTMKASASGGIATALSEAVIAKGGCVAGVAYTPDFHGAEYILVEKKEALSRLQGSKYIEADRKNIYQDVKRLVEAGRLVLFIGLPCTVAAMQKIMGKANDRLITCELICHGPTMGAVHTQYVQALERKFASPLRSFSVRYKKEGWTPSYLRGEFENGAVYEAPFDATAYGYAFRTMGLPGCYHCPFKGDNRTGDLMVGDFWGATEQDEFWNANGVSVIFVHTKKGEALLREAPNISLFETDFARAVAQNPMVISSRPSAPNRARFEALFRQYGLFGAMNRAFGLRHRMKAALLELVGKGFK